MEVGSPEWIEASLAKLDDLERQQGEHETALEAAHDPLTLKQHNDALERLDVEIKSLYAQLESIADDDEGEDEGEDEGADGGEAEVADDAAAAVEQAPAPAAAEPVAATPVAPGVQPVSPAEALTPLDATPIAAAADNPFASPSAGADLGGGGGFDATPMSFDDGDLKPAGGGGKWAFLAIVVAAGLGIGGYFVWQNLEAQKQQDQPKAEAGPVKVIKAAEVPDDTEAPNAAKGGDATISPTANGGTNKAGGGGGGGGGGGRKNTDDKKTKPLELKGGGDPLSG